MYFIKSITAFLVLFLAVSAIAIGQKFPPDSSNVSNKVPETLEIIKTGFKNIQITQSFQLWNVHTLESQGNHARESRNDMYVRRGRLGVKGHIVENLAFNVAFAYDGIGRDEKTAGNGSPNPDDNHDFFLWEAFTMWTYKPLWNITAGYFRPQVGRENITAAFKTLSFEKSLSNFQPRAHFLARGTGREMGINLGGLHLGTGWSINYNVGLYDVSREKLIGEGSKWAPLIASRVAFTVGDPEMKKYGIGYRHSYYGQRKGITLALNSSYQGETEIFTANSFYGGDILANWGPLDFTVEYDWLYRNSLIAQEIPGPEQLNQQQEPLTLATTDKVMTYKIGYNFLLKNGKILQATAMYSSQLAPDQGDIQGFNALTGASDQQVYDVGINYLIDKEQLKLNLHFVWGERTDKIPDHQYAYLGTGLQYLF